MGITPIVPRTGPGFVVLSFQSTSDARHFEGTVSRKRRNKDIPESIHTQRWAISSSALAGDEESIFMSKMRVNFYTEHMESEGLEFKLHRHHIRMIRISTSQKFVKGKQHVIFDFLNPCDRVSSLLFMRGLICSGIMISHRLFQT